MRRGARIAVGSVVVLGVVLALGALTRLDYPATADRSELRLAWRFRVPRAEHCRRPTAEELESLPVHMRQAEICEARPASYRLEVRVDDELRHRSTVEASGARGDRPLYVFQALPLEPGDHRLRVTFERADPSGGDGEPGEGEAGGDAASGAGGETGAGDLPAPGHAAPVPDRLVLDRRVRAAVHEALLVTYDPEARMLVVRGGEGR